MRWALVGFGAICLVFGSLWLFSGYTRANLYNGYYYGMPMMRIGGGWGMGLGIICVIFICLLLMMLFRSSAWRSGYHRMGYQQSDQAEEILRQRYARGEVTKEQFDQMLRDLREVRN
jgi:putative membrane protein